MLLRVAIFYGLTFIFTILLALIQQILGIGFDKITLPQLGPGIAALAMLIFFKKDKIKINLSVKDVGILKYSIATLLPLIVSGVVFLIYNQFIGNANFKIDSPLVFLVILGGMFIGAFGEEFGWRGYLQKLLKQKQNALISGILIGLLWGLWHIGNYQYGLFYLIFFLLSTIGSSVVLVWLLHKTNYNVRLATLFHISLNIGYYVFFRDVLSDPRFMLVNGVTWIIISIVAVIIGRGFLWNKESA
jgi:membrane protease YdiL (CAAX protease family)